MSQATVIDKHNQASQFDPARLHKSIKSACVSVGAYDGDADKTAAMVCEKVAGWLMSKKEVTSRDIRRVAGKNLMMYHPEASYIYKSIETII